MKRLHTSMIPIAILLLGGAAAAQPSDPGQQDSEMSAVYERSREKFEEDAERDRQLSAAPNGEGRLAMKAYGQCIARKAPTEAARILTMNFTTAAYRTGLKMLSEEGRRSCAAASVGKGTMRSPGILFAGEVAEALIRSGPAPTCNALAKAAMAPATPYFSHIDRIAICVVRSAPDQVSALFDAERDSAGETKALDDLTYAVAWCAKAMETKKPLEINPAGLRAMLATAAFRSIISSKGSF